MKAIMTIEKSGTWFELETPEDAKFVSENTNFLYNILKIFPKTSLKSAVQ